MISSKPTVLVVDDEPQIHRLLRFAVEDEGYQVISASTGKDGLLQATTRAPDVVLLDLGLPDMSGIEFLELFRQWSQSPVIILSARGDESAKVMALDCGADDYLTKPFRIPELQARLRVALRHANRQTGSSNTPIYQNGGLQVDLDKRRVTLHGEDLHLTPIEYRLLAVLVRHSGAVVTHQVLMREVWGEAYVNETHYLRVYMRQLRQKLDDDGSKPRYLETATRIGYRLRDEAPAA